MKTPTKFVKPLMDEQREQLKEIMKSQGPQRKRMRAHAVLLSERGYSIDPIADIYQVDRDRVSKWLEWWEKYQFEGLDDDPRSGRPPKLTEKEQKKAVEITLEEPRSLRQGLSKIAEQIGKTISRDTLKRMLALNEYVWKRMRRSLKSLRNEEEFRAAQAELATLRTEALDPTREFDLFYFDEAGFTLTPCIPYAWQKVGQTFELASAHGPRQNVLGFLNLHHEFHAFAFEGSINTSIVTHCFDLFSQQLEPISKPIRCKILYKRGLGLCSYSIRHDTKMYPVGNYPIVSGNESNPSFRNRNLGCVDAASTANTLVDVLVPSPAK
jgi:transposase